MKKFLFLLLLTAGLLQAQSETLDLGVHGKITMYISEKWVFDVSDFGDRRMVTIKPKDDTNAECSMNITFPDRDRYETKARLKQRVEVDGAKLAEAMVEGKAYAKEFSLGTGFGYRCDFTDPNLVGKPPKKNDFKTMSIGVIHLSADVLIEISIAADGFSSAPYNELLGAVEGMEFKPGRGSR